jgi:hypothetical protein
MRLPSTLVYSTAHTSVGHFSVTNSIVPLLSVRSDCHQYRSFTSTTTHRLTQIGGHTLLELFRLAQQREAGWAMPVISGASAPSCLVESFGEQFSGLLLITALHCTAPPQPPGGRWWRNR